MSLAFINSLIIPVPSDLVAKYAHPSDDCPLFDTVANTLILRVQPGGYQPRKKDKRDREDGYAAPVLTVSTPLYGFEVSIFDGRQEIFDCLEEMDYRARTTTPGQYQLITILDYVRPHFTDRAIGYSTRVGYFEDLEPSSGTVRDSLSDLTSRRWGNGLKFTFYEANRRP